MSVLGPHIWNQLTKLITHATAKHSQCSSPQAIDQSQTCSTAPRMGLQNHGKDTNITRTRSTALSVLGICRTHTDEQD